MKLIKYLMFLFNFILLVSFLLNKEILNSEAKRQVWWYTRPIMSIPFKEVHIIIMCVRRARACVCVYMCV